MPGIDTRFRMVKEAGVHDYIDKTPDPHEIEEFEAASEKYELPVRAELIDATGETVAAKYLGRIPRRVSLALDIDEWLREAAKCPSIVPT